MAQCAALSTVACLAAAPYGRHETHRTYWEERVHAVRCTAGCLLGHYVSSQSCSWQAHLLGSVLTTAGGMALVHISCVVHGWYWLQPLPEQLHSPCSEQSGTHCLHCPSDSDAGVCCSCWRG